MSQLPLFPLQTVLFPGIAISLQVFEQRYLNLVSRSMKSGTGFGIVAIREGREVGAAPQVYDVGVKVQITDWYQQPNNLLGIRVLAERKFRVLASDTLSDQLLMAEVDYLPSEPASPMGDFEWQLAKLVDELKGHPALAGYHFPVIDDVRALGWQLAQLLPIEPEHKIRLLEMADPRQRVVWISRWLDRTAADNY